MSWTRVGALLPAVLAGCASVSVADAGADAGPSQPSVASVDPQPGTVQGASKFTVQFSAAMDEGQLVARTGRSETVVLAGESTVELAAAAIEHGNLSAYERTLLVPAQPTIAPDRTSLTLTPDQPLAAGKLYLLVSSRLKDGDGRPLGAGARFAFDVAAAAGKARLIEPAAGSDAPSNLRLVRAFAPSGRLSLHGPDGTEVAAANAQGEVMLSLSSAPVAGASYVLALDGVEDAAQSFTGAACARDAAPALQGPPSLSVRDTSVLAEIALDWPAKVTLQVGAAGADPCAGPCATATTFVSCAAKACGPQAFDCRLSLHIDGLSPAHDYGLRVVAEDDLGHLQQGPVQRFSTVAPLPRLIVSEVMNAPPSPQGEAEYVEILNQGPGAAVLDGLAFVAEDGVVRPLVAAPPPLPVQLAPGARALAVGALFNPARYPSLPPGTPVLRASTKRLLGRGLNDTALQAFRLMLRSEVPVELSQVPSGTPKCPPGASLQRDEAVPPGGEAAWTCGLVGGTPGAPP